MIVALVVLAVLTVTPREAWAACAWVLWVQSYAVHDGKPITRVEDPSDAFATKDECEFVLQRREQREKMRRASDSSRESYFTCLPDTIDPRGPKGGAR
jgi:hypothetical protein